MARLEINYQYIKQNIEQLNKEKEIIAVVKNNAYNMDLVDTVIAMHQVGIDYFATTNINEAISIRQTLAHTKILLLNPSYEFSKLREFNIEANIPSLDYLKENFNQLKDLTFHLEYAGLMRRAGAKSLEEANAILDFCKNNNIYLKGYWSHFAFADEFDGNYEKEKCNTLSVYRALSKDYQFDVVHLQNSASYLRDGAFTEATHIRLGIMLYGSYPYNVKEHPTKITYTPKQAFSVYANIINIIHLHKGECIGYANALVANQDMKVATVDIGYGDGILRSRLTGKTCIVNGQEVKILVTMMSHIIIECYNFNIGDEVVIYSDELPLYQYNKYCNSNSEQMAVLNKNSLEVKKIY